ncbi:uncharacterized protein LOC125810259 [Solanum verrucosum]|uniref:uncharacterized protein LOC125810259 n=1 Tax=Solanum verrucosum TaxID=315347 RepID=UPI0020D114FD|nr:uncharacterized protein LOC125810259 [Solanum verrucosum]
MSPSTSVVNVNAAPVLKHLIQFNPSSQLPIKLSGNHIFTIWKAEIAMLHHGHDLYSNLDGTKLSPPETVTTNGHETANPEYTDWFCQDKLIQNALMASIDATIASTIAYPLTSKTSVGSTSHFLCDQIAEPHLQPSSPSQSSSPVNNKELVVKVLSGLGLEFCEISAAIPVHDSPISYEELFDKLLDHELFIKHEDLKITTTQVTAVVSQRVTNPPSVPCHNRGATSHTILHESAVNFVTNLDIRQVFAALGPIAALNQK